MNIKEKMKSYSFWVSLTSAVVLVVKLIGQKYGFVIDDGFISDLVTSLCGILVILGIIVLPAKKDNKEEKTKTNLTKSENENCVNDNVLNSVSNQLQEEIDNIISRNFSEEPKTKKLNEDIEKIEPNSEPIAETNCNAKNEEFEEHKENPELLENDNGCSILKNSIDVPSTEDGFSEREEETVPNTNNESTKTLIAEEKLRAIFENPDKLEALNQILSNFLENKNHNE